MYEKHFGLDRRPFTLAPDPEFIFWTRQHRLGATILDLGIERVCPIILVTGEVGTGKTLLIRQFLRTSPRELTIGLLSNFLGEHDELYKWILMAFGQDHGGSGRPLLHERLEAFFVGEYAAGRRSVLIVDEAQSVSDGEIETLRLLTNINSGKDALVMLVLVGQPQLRERLKRPECRQIAQRIGADFHLEPMAAEETQGYVVHRVAVAGGPPDLFAPDAVARIHTASGGVPRVVNTLADMCLVAGFGEGVPRIDGAFAASVLDEARRNGALAMLPPVAGPAPAVLPTGRTWPRRALAGGRDDVVVPLVAASRETVPRAAPNGAAAAQLTPAREAAPDFRLEHDPALHIVTPEVIPEPAASPEPPSNSVSESVPGSAPGSAPERAPEAAPGGAAPGLAAAADAPPAAGTAPAHAQDARPVRRRGFRIAGGASVLANAALVGGLGIGAALIAWDSARQPASPDATTAPREAAPVAAGPRLADTEDGVPPALVTADATEEAPADAAAEPAEAPAGAASEPTEAPADAATEPAEPLPSAAGGAAVPVRLPPAPAAIRAAETPAELYRAGLEIAVEDPAAAALAFARAAAEGHARAAYFLAQMYETGDGVPVDRALARAWYAAAGGDRAEARLAVLGPPNREGPVRAPRLLAAAPAPATAPVKGGKGGVDLVWTGGGGADPAGFVVELAAAPGSPPLLSQEVAVSAMHLDAPDAARVWRVLARDGAGGTVASDWAELPGPNP